MLINIAFYTFSCILLFFATLAVKLKNPVHAVLSLVVCFFSVAWVFISLKSEYLAMLMLVVYVGAIAVMFLFTVMMLGTSAQKTTTNPHFSKLTGLVVFIIFLFSIKNILLSDSNLDIQSLDRPSIHYISFSLIIESMYIKFMPFIPILAFLLLGAMVGVILLTLDNKNPKVKYQSIKKQISKTPENSVELVKVKPGEGVNLNLNQS